jgi:hypothetical protein
MKIAVFRSGTSSVIVVKTFLECTYKADLIFSENIKNKKHE